MKPKSMCKTFTVSIYEANQSIDFQKKFINNGTVLRNSARVKWTVYTLFEEHKTTNRIFMVHNWE